jgi:phage terminase large subunit-like protein
MSMSIDRALADHRLLGGALGDPGSWSTWLVVLKAAFGLPLSDAELATFHKVAGDRPTPVRRVRELWCVCARRSGKSRVAAALAVYLSLFERHKLARGELGHVLVLAPTADQARTVFQYCSGFVDGSGALRREVASTTATEIKLRNNTVIGVHACSHRSVRGRTLLATIADETAFWRSEESAVPDVEVYRAVMPSLVASGGMLIGISTPYRRHGIAVRQAPRSLRPCR